MAENLSQQVTRLMKIPEHIRNIDICDNIDLL